MSTQSNSTVYQKIDSKRVAEAFGYTPEELQSIPADAHMGLGCGNPVASASLHKVRELEVQCLSTKREIVCREK